MSQIRTDKTAIASVNVQTLEEVCAQIVLEKSGRIEKAARNWAKNKTETSDCGIAIYTDAVPNGLAVHTKGGLHYTGDEYGHVEAFFSLQRRVTGDYLDAEIDKALVAAGFTVLRKAFGTGGAEFTATDFAGRQAIILRGSDGKLTTNFEGYEGNDCHDAQKAISRMLMARGIGIQEVSVSPKDDEKWLTVRTQELTTN